MTGGYQVAVDYNETAFLALGQGKIEGVAYPVIICIVVFVAAHFLGAKPHIFGTILGVFFIYMVSSGMSMAGFPFAARQLFSGIVLILAVGANAMLNREELHMKFI